MTRIAGLHVVSHRPAITAEGFASFADPFTSFAWNILVLVVPFFQAAEVLFALRGLHGRGQGGKGDTGGL